MDFWEEYGGLLWINIWEFVHIYGSLWGSWEYMGGFWESMEEYEYTGIYGYSWEIMVVYGQNNPDSAYWLELHYNSLNPRWSDISNHNYQNRKPCTHNCGYQKYNLKFVALLKQIYRSHLSLSHE